MYIARREDRFIKVYVAETREEKTWTDVREAGKLNLGAFQGVWDDWIPMYKKAPEHVPKVQEFKYYKELYSKGGDSK